MYHLFYMALDSQKSCNRYMVCTARPRERLQRCQTPQYGVSQALSLGVPTGLGDMAWCNLDHNLSHTRLVLHYLECIQ